MKSAITRPALWALGFCVAGVLAGTLLFDNALTATLSSDSVLAAALSSDSVLTAALSSDSVLAATLLSDSVLAAVLLFVFSVCVCGILYKKYRYGPVFFFMLFLAMGMWRGASRMVMPEVYSGRVLYGRVLDTAGLTAAGNQRAVVRVRQDGGPDLRLMMYVRPHLPRVQIGQEVRLTGEIQPLARAQNPGGYDAFLHLRTQKIDAAIWPDAITVGGVQTNFFVQMRRVRDRIAAVFDEVLPAQEAGIIRSMVLGDRESLDRDLVEIYRVAGIRHVLSISGLHVTILTLFINVLLGKILNPRKAGITTLVIMVLYCLMTGAAIATIRAVMMGGVLVFAKILYRDYDFLTSISWACAALLLYEPLMIYNVGFQLSFGAVFGIAVLTAPIERLLTIARLPAYGKFRNAVAVSMAAGFSTYIVFAHHFYEIPLYSVFANVLLIPFMMGLLVLGVITGLLGLVSTAAASVSAGLVFFVLRMYETASRFFGALPMALLPTGGGSVLVSLTAAAVLLIFAYAMHGFGTEIKKRLPLLLFAIVTLMFTVYIRDFPPRIQTTHLYTHGNYTVHRHHRESRIYGTGRGGEQTVIRYLNRRNIQRADALTLSEFPRPGDATRLTPLMVRTHTLYLPTPQRPLPSALQRAADENNVEIRWR